MTLAGRFSRMFLARPPERPSDTFFNFPKVNTRPCRSMPALFLRFTARLSILEACNALKEIRDSRLYRDVLGFETFEEYCKNKCDMGQTHDYRPIESAHVQEILSPMGDIQPINERQARPLVRLEPEQQNGPMLIILLNHQR